MVCVRRDRRLTRETTSGVVRLPHARAIEAARTLRSTVSTAPGVPTDAAKTPHAPTAHRQLFVGSSIEVVLAVLADAALLTAVLAADPDSELLSGVVGSSPPVAVVVLALLVLWDLWYRIGPAGGRPSVPSGAPPGSRSTRTQ